MALYSSKKRKNIFFQVCSGLFDASFGLIGVYIRDVFSYLFECAKTEKLDCDGVDLFQFVLYKERTERLILPILVFFDPLF
jgi:hypothetical protein